MNEKCTDQYTLRLIKTVRAKAGTSFDAFTDPTQLSRWFTEEATADLRIGGRYSNSDGDKGKFLEIDPPRWVKFTWENEKHCPNTIVEVEFVDSSPGRTEIHLTHSSLASKENVEEMKEGWGWALVSLASYLETGKPVSFKDWKRQNANRAKS